MTVSFEVIGKPQAKQRPRLTSGGYAYTPKETIQYENLVRIEYYTQVGNKRLEGPIRADLKFYYEPPRSVSKKKREQMLNGQIAYTKKSDLDNLAKSILDSLNAVAYADDAQIVELHVTKAYGEKARAEINLEEVDSSRASQDG